jgi:hypothetical protein
VTAIDPIILDTLTTEGGALVLSYRSRLPDDHPPWQAMMSYSGPEHPTALGRPPGAAYGYGVTPSEAFAALSVNLTEQLTGGD